MAEEQTTPPEQNPSQDSLSAPEVGRVRAFLQRLGGREDTQTPEQPELTDEQIDQALAELVDSLEDPSPPDPATTATAGPSQPAVASLSQTDPATIELAQRVERAEVRAGSAELANRLNGYLEAGVPPTLIKAAKDQLLGESDEHKAIAIDFANGKEPAAAKALFAVLDGAKGTIDFSEQGSGDPATDDATREAEVEAWYKQSTFGRGT